MKRIRRAAAVLCAAGAVLLCAAIAATMLGLSLGGELWAPMRDKLVSVGVDVNFGMRLRFDTQTYAALSAYSPEMTAEEAAGYFGYFASVGNDAQAQKREADAQAALVYFETEFDAEGFLASYALREDAAQEKALTETFAYLDGLSMQVGAGGKLPGMKKADNRPAFEEFYVQWALQYGEEAGSFAQFVQAVGLLVRAEIENGYPVTNAAEWVGENLTIEMYRGALLQVQNAEKGGAESGESDGFVLLAQKKAAGEEVDFEGFFMAEYEAIRQEHAGEELPHHGLFLICMRDMAQSGSFDRSGIFAQMESAQRLEEADSFGAFMVGFGETVIRQAEKAAETPAAGVVWKAVSLKGPAALLGFALLLLGCVAERVCRRALAAKPGKYKKDGEEDVLLRVEGLRQYFRNGNQVTKAVDGISFCVKKGEVLGLVGESGCGKTTTGRAVIGLYEPTEGEIFFRGERLLPGKGRKKARERAAKMQMIFQDPVASLDPRMTVGEIVAEGLVIRGVKDKKHIDEKVCEVLQTVGLLPEHVSRYPHEFSGGQRQRIGIARAIVMEPELIIADEPVSALDVSVQAQVINLLDDLRRKMGLTVVFIAHDLSVVKHFSDRIAVMYRGKIVEMASSDELFMHPLHPYTKALISAIPQPDPICEKQRRRTEYVPAQGEFAQECLLREIAPGHSVYCSEAGYEAYKKELGI